MKRPIVLAAKVEDSELDAIRLAAGLLQKSLSEAGEPIEVQYRPCSSFDEMKRSQNDAIVLTSLLAEVENYAEPWATVERRLQDYYAALSEKTGGQIFVLTVFRYVGTNEHQDSSAKLVRIRQLNRLAADLSRRYGVLVVDLDRDLANVGARRLQTNYRLGGGLVTSLVGRSIALALLSAGLDEYVAFDIQDEARNAILRDRSDFNLPLVTDVAPSNTLSLTSGRRKQVVKTIVDNNSESHASWLIHLLLSGKLGIGDAAKKLQKSIARRGIGASTILLLSAARESLVHRNRLDK
jgi:hypothetical protein